MYNNIHLQISIRKVCFNLEQTFLIDIRKTTKIPYIDMLKNYKKLLIFLLTKFE